MKYSVPIALLALLALLLSPGPAAWAGKKGAVAAAPADGGPDTRSLEGGVFLQSDEIIHNEDGTLTWFYVTNHVDAPVLMKSLEQLKLPNVKMMTRKRDIYKIPYDTRNQRSVPGPLGRPELVDDPNVLILTFPADYKDVLQQLLERFDVPEPQVFIKAKVVEVTLDNDLEYGTSVFFDRSKATSGNPDTFFRGFQSGFRPASFQAPFLSPDNTGIGLLFDQVGQSEGALTVQIEALEKRGSANILSEPSILATQGQLATLITGEKTPVSHLTLSGNTETITTDFEETGIRLDFTPLHIGRDYVKLRVRPEVSSVTSFLEVKGPTTTLQNPVISQRYAETVVTIRDGMTLVIGGLYSISEINNRDGVPILGDIPILRFLFSRTKRTKVKTELDFFITPYILRHRLDKNVFVPPMEKERLQKSQEGSGGR